MILIGYVHYKKSGAFKAEADISMEANPHLYRILTNTEMLFPLYLKMSELLIKLSKNEKLSEDETKEIISLQNQLKEHMQKKSLDSSGKPIRWNFINDHFLKLFLNLFHFYYL